MVGEKREDGRARRRSLGPKGRKVPFSARRKREKDKARLSFGNERRHIKTGNLEKVQ
jgi:hypothetical protein